MCKPQRTAFSLLELLVVVGIICMLLAMLVPALRWSRDGCVGNRSTTCRNNLANIALAMLNHENTHREFPGYINRFKVENSSTRYLTNSAGDEIPVSWVIPLFPNLDRPDLLLVWKHASPGAIIAGDELNSLPSSQMPILECPSSRYSTGLTNHYVLNTGLLDQLYSSDLTARPLDLAENGVFLDRFREPGRKVTLASITSADGASQTIMATENVDASDDRHVQEHQLGAVWRDAAGATGPAPPLPMHRINIPNRQGTAADSARPSSYHPGGVNVAFCDRHVRFVSQEIDYLVYCQLMAPHDRRARQPNGDPLLLDSDGNRVPDLNEADPKLLEAF